MRERPADFLLERLEEPGRDHEDEGPEAVERGVLGVAQLARRQDLEAVRGDADDDQPAADRVGALGQRTVLGRTDQPLRSLCHSPSLGCPEIRDCTAAGSRGRCRGPGSRRVGSTVLGVSTRTLLILAALTGLAILVAFAVQVTVVAN